MNRTTLLLLCGIYLAVPMTGAALDFDGDGLDDPIAYENQRDGSRNELAFTYLPSSTGVSIRHEFGSAKEFPALADYDGDGTADFAVVGPNYDANPSGDLVWRMKLSSEDLEESTLTFGQVGDTYLSGCSFDGDALADQAIIRANMLYVRKSSDSSEASMDLEETDLKQFTCGDVDGDGRADLVAQGSLLRNGVKQSYFLAWDVLSGQKILDVQFGSGVSDIFAVDIDGDGTKELAYRKDRDGHGRKIVVRVNGAALTLALPRFQAVDFGRFAAGSQAEGMFLKIPRDDLVENS